MRALFDIGSNITLLDTKLAEKIGLNVDKYILIFWVALGAIAYFIGWFSRTKLQSHDSLAVMGEGIQIIDGAVNHMSIILEIHAFDLRGRFFRQHHLQ